MLESIARVLRLDDESITYAEGLASEKGRTDRRRSRREAVPAGVHKLIAGLGLPAFVEGRYLDVLAVNSVATAI